MRTITFTEIAAIVAEHRRAEAVRTAPLPPAALACEALDLLRAALGACLPRTRAEIVDELRVLVAEHEAAEWQAFGSAYAAREG